MSIALSSVSAFAAAVARARSVDISSYTLRPGAVRDALLAAARAGAGVRVRLERNPLDDAAGTLHQANADTIQALNSAGADAATTSAGAPTLHMKAAAVDGVAWLDDRNWAGDGPETVLRDTDPDDVRAVTEALAGGRGADGHLRSSKGAAQYLEVDLIREAGSASVAVESESFGSCAIYSALLARARSGLPTRLIVAGREAAANGTSGETERRRLAKLQSFGVEVRTGEPGGADLDEKLAVAGRAAWAGSANATYAGGAAGEQRDWGMVTREAELVAELGAKFEANWHTAIEFVASVPDSPVAPNSEHDGCNIVAARGRPSR